MTSKILIIDADPAFAHILHDGLKSQVEVEAHVVDTSAEALTTVVEKAVDLVIVDVNLTDMDPAKLIAAIREAKSSMKIMVTAFMGQAIPENVEALETQGVLNKPFFVGDLPRLVGEALGLDLVRKAPPKEPVAAEPADEEVAEFEKEAAAETGDEVEAVAGLDEFENLALPAIPEETLNNLRAHEEEIVRHLSDLNVEVNAEAILLTAGGALVAFTGVNLTRERANKMAALVALTAETAARAATFLGEPSGRFEQGLHEGDTFRLYSYSLSQGIILSLALSSKLPLGILRHQTRQTSRELTRYIY